MNWACLRFAPWLDTRARFVSRVPRGGQLLDLGSSDGETLNHIAQLRPDLRLRSVDLEGAPGHYPKGCEFARANLETDRLPWPDASVDAVTCMHLVEHLQVLETLFAEVARLLKPGGAAYFETPHPKTVDWPSAKGHFTLNFHDDPTHVAPVPTERLAAAARAVGLKPSPPGISRNWLFAAAWPLLFFAPASRKRFTARIHWGGWSACLTMEKPE
ncbi:MAG: class I SAM-dependent methyltransferase [Verrucomicrobia bacterium]|jgi:SAM-dependent methyltransferase|nr:class I SAM-dependent methyltransferase [Verrucomicrobiota bacterium]